MSNKWASFFSYSSTRRYFIVFSSCVVFAIFLLFIPNTLTYHVSYLLLIPNNNSSNNYKINTNEKSPQLLDDFLMTKFKKGM